MIAHVLVVDDDQERSAGTGDVLEHAGFVVHGARSAQAARAGFFRRRPHAVIVDFKLPDVDSLALVREFRRTAADVPVLVSSAPATVESALAAMRAGACDVVTLPGERMGLVDSVRRAVQNARRPIEPVAPAAPAARLFRPDDPFASRSSRMEALRAQAPRLWLTNAPLLLLGETGTGKGVLARWLHAQGGGSGAFVDINCAGLSSEFLQSELFGHARGAFTGAVSSRSGLLEVAQGGTLFLDEVGDMPLDVQSKLLKVVEERRFRRMGEVQERTTDARFILATHRNLEELAHRGQFRSDLYFRVSGLTLTLPALRDRLDDIPQLAAVILERFATSLSRRPPRLAPEALSLLRAHSWPGNIRELRNVVERTMLLTDSDVIHARDLHLDLPVPVVPPFRGTLEEAERALIRATLAEEHGNVPSAATRLGIPRSTLYARLKRHGFGRDAVKP